jgi:hypothetical protein
VIEAKDGTLGFFDGQFSFNLTGQPGQEVRVEVSADLIHWEPLEIITLREGLNRVVDPGSANAPRRFYRTVTE